jgi:hypothetical protein
MRVVLGGFEELLEVGIGDSQGQWAVTGHVWQGEVTADRQIPRLVYNLRGRAKEAASNSLAPALEAAPQLLGLERRYRHALAVQRIEACHGVTDSQETVGKAAQLLVAPSLVRRERMADQFSEPLPLADCGKDVSRSDRSKKGDKRVVIRRWVVLHTVA